MSTIVISTLLDPKKVIRFLVKYFLAVLVIVIVVIGIYTTVFHMAWSNYEETITSDVEYRDVSLTTLCSVLTCDAILIKSPDGNTSLDRFFIKDDNTGSFILNFDNDRKAYEKVFYNFTMNGNLVLNGNGYKLYIGSDFIMDILWNTLYILLFITLLPYTIVTVGLYAYNRKKEIISNKKLKDDMELSLQRNITEMVHHELNAPLALILAQVDDLFYKTFGFNHNNSGYLDGKIPEEKVEKGELFEDIYFSIERINSVLSTLARSKHIKFNNGTVPLKTIIKNIESSINAFKVEKIKVTIDYNDYDLFSKHSIASEIGNGAMMNILHILFTNALEAYSTEIKITGEMADKNVLHMYITDNGCGVKNEKGEYKVTQKLFNNGYSTKGKYQGGVETFLMKLLRIRPENSERGIGLYMVKNLLKSNNGDIMAVSTSECGTTFKLILPVKDTEKK